MRRTVKITPIFVALGIALLSMPMFLTICVDGSNEAVSNLGAIVLYEETYFSVNDGYMTTVPNPPRLPKDDSRQNFAPNRNGWNLLGRVIPDRTPLYYQYEVRAGRYDSKGNPIVDPAKGLVSPSEIVRAGGGDCVGLEYQISAEKLRIPSSSNSNWFYATGVRQINASGKCELWVKVIDKNNLIAVNEPPPNPNLGCKTSLRRWWDRLHLFLYKRI